MLCKSRRAPRRLCVVRQARSGLQNCAPCATSPPIGAESVWLSCVIRQASREHVRFGTNKWSCSCPHVAGSFSLLPKCGQILFLRNVRNSGCAMNGPLALQLAGMMICCGLGLWLGFRTRRLFFTDPVALPINHFRLALLPALIMTLGLGFGLWASFTYEAWNSPLFPLFPLL